MAKWLGFRAFTAMTWVQRLVGEQRSHKPCGVKIILFRTNSKHWADNSVTKTRVGGVRMGLFLSLVLCFFSQPMLIAISVDRT